MRTSSDELSTTIDGIQVLTGSCRSDHAAESEKRVDEMLPATDLHFRQIVDGIPAPITVMNREGELEPANRQVLEYFGKTLDELKCRMNEFATAPWAAAQSAFSASRSPRTAC